MRDVFERMAPAYQNVVRRYARKLWLNYDKEGADKEFLFSANRFRKRYALSLAKFYVKEGVRIYPGTIAVKSDQWFEDQKALMQNVQTIADTKKDKLKQALVKQAEKGGRDVQEIIDTLYLTPDERKTQTVHRVFSFSKNMQKRADQIGEQAAYDLGSDMNNAVIDEQSGIYEWQSQEDSDVRKTHTILNGKIFSFANDPTTVDKYGNVHRGPPGTDWGCRCWARLVKRGKPLLNFVARG